MAWLTVSLYRILQQLQRNVPTNCDGQLVLSVVWKNICHTLQNRVTPKLAAGDRKFWAGMYRNYSQVLIATAGTFLGKSFSCCFIKSYSLQMCFSAIPELWVCITDVRSSCFLDVCCRFLYNPSASLLTRRTCGKWPAGWRRSRPAS